MLHIVEEKAGIRAAQARLERALQTALPSQGLRNIGYPGGNGDHIIYAAGPGKLYCAFAPPRPDSAVPRYWNSFGLFRADASAQEITVEINVPVSGDDARVAGFFATNSDTGDVYLMHDGGVGGGRKGIGKAAFLDFVSDPLVEVQGKTRTRTAMMIANLNDPGLAALVWRFVGKAYAFKQARTRLADADGQRPPEEKDYVPEFSGRKRGTRPGEFDYVTYHGLVVDELKRVREPSLAEGERIGRSRLVDLFVSDGRHRREIYEVKTACDRQSLYTGIGQLVTHGPEPSTVRTLLLPTASGLPDDCVDAMRRLNIKVRRFRISGEGLDVRVRILAA